MRGGWWSYIVARIDVSTVGDQELDHIHVTFVAGIVEGCVPGLMVRGLYIQVVRLMNQREIAE